MANGNTFLVAFGGIVILLLVILVIIEAVPRHDVAPPMPVPSPTPPSPPHILGGCSGTRWGCCPDGRTPRADPLGTNCGQPWRPWHRRHRRHRRRPWRPVRPVRPAHHLIGGCAGTRWGCCSDGVTPKRNAWDMC